MILTGYAMLLSVYLWLEFCLIVTLTFDFADFQAHRMETTDFIRRVLNLKIVSTILTFSQAKREILKVAPLEVDQGDPHVGGLGVLMMHDLYFYFSCKTKGSVP